MKICTIIGARPQFIKAAAVSKALAGHGGLAEIIIHTGQHYDHGMSEIFFEELDIPQPGYNLGIGSGNHGAQTGQMLMRIEQVLLKEKPDRVLIYGDTNSTLAGALAAVKLHIRVAHVEAGLRSFNRVMPEEINRIAADAVSDILFTPSRHASEQLKREGHADEKIIFSGDVMYDVMLGAFEKARKTSRILPEYGIEAGRYMLVTVHRAENTDNPKHLSAIINALLRVSETTQIVFPVHPRTQAAMEREGLTGKAAAALRLLPPVGYLDMVALLDGAKAVATDSGGVQKEAFFNRKPCFTLRGETEWVELVESGWNRLVPPGNPYEMAAKLNDLTYFSRQDISPYGKGNAAEIIASHLACHICE